MLGARMEHAAAAGGGGRVRTETIPPNDGRAREPLALIVTDRGNEVQGALPPPATVVGTRHASSERELHRGPRRPEIGMVPGLAEEREAGEGGDVQVAAAIDGARAEPAGISR